MLHADIATKRLSSHGIVERYADFLRVVDSVTPYVDPHQVFVIFTGGEALVRSDLKRCGVELYSRGYL